MRLVLGFVAGGLLAAFVLGELGDHWWFGGLFAHFRYHILVVVLPFLAIAMLSRAWIAGAVMAIVVTGHVFLIVNVPKAPSVAGPVPGATRLRVVTLNIGFSNPVPDRAVRYLVAAKADIVLIQEIDGRIASSIAQLKRSYPYIAPPDWRAGAENIILSRVPFASVETLNFPQNRATAVAVSLRLQGALLNVMTVHPYPAMSAFANDVHRSAFERFANVVRGRSGAWIVGGDFNATPWASRFRRLLRRTGLRLSGLSYRWPQSWPVPQSFGAPSYLRIGIPIDHVLVSRHFARLKQQRGPWVGSDHAPLTVDLVLLGKPVPSRE